jgi:hypothetical protein
MQDPLRLDFPDVIDNTILNTFRSCPQKAFRSYIEHWKPTGTNVHLHAGAAFARGLEVARKAFYDHNATAEDAAAVGLQALVEAYGDFECPSDSAKSLERMCGAFEYTLDVWPLGTDPAKPWRKLDGSHAIEFSFAEPLDLLHPVTGNPLIYSGRADMIVDLEGGRFVEDDKTTSSLGRSWSGQWELRSQFTGYTWAALRSGIKVDGVLVRGTSILKTKYDHAQAITYRPQWEIDRWYEQTLRDLKRMIRAWEEGYWDFNLGEACNEYGTCAFAPICKKAEPEEWLPAYFIQRKWNPLTRTEEEIKNV